MTKTEKISHIVDVMQPLFPLTDDKETMRDVVKQILALGPLMYELDWIDESNQNNVNELIRAYWRYYNSVIKSM